MYCFALVRISVLKSISLLSICAYFVSIVFFDIGRKLRMYECQGIEG